MSEMPANLDLVPWYDEAESIAARAESTGESQLAYNIASLVWSRVAQARAEAFEEAAKIAADHASHYPADIFIEPPPGQHGATVDGCSARAHRGASEIIAAAIRRAAQGDK